MGRRAHIVLSGEVLAALDTVAGARRRSRFVEAAVKEKLSRMELEAALRDTAGTIDPVFYPDWRTAEKTSRWVRGSRQRDRVRLRKKLQHHRG
jgi:hypothetical protein